MDLHPPEHGGVRNVGSRQMPEISVRAKTRFLTDGRVANDTTANCRETSHTFKRPTGTSPLAQGPKSY